MQAPLHVWEHLLMLLAIMLHMSTSQVNMALHSPVLWSKSSALFFQTSSLGFWQKHVSRGIGRRLAIWGSINDFQSEGPCSIYWTGPTQTKSCSPIEHVQHEVVLLADGICKIQKSLVELNLKTMAQDKKSIQLSKVYLCIAVHLPTDCKNGLKGLIHEVGPTHFTDTMLSHIVKITNWTRLSSCFSPCFEDWAGTAV